jgi:putative aldouronate transport system substrate-binding protein
MRKMFLLLVVLALVLPAGLNGVTAQDGPDKVVIWSPGDNATVKDWNTDPILMAVEEATNTDIEMVKIDWTSYIDQLNAAALSGDLPDIIGTIEEGRDALIQSWVEDGVLAAYEGDVAAAAPNVLAEYEHNPLLKEIMVDGKIYAQPVGWGDDTYPNMGLIHVRADLLDKYGMEQPNTFEEYFAFLRAAVADGHTGVIFNAAEGIGPAINAFAGAYGLPMRGWVPLADGGYGYYAVQPGMKDALLLFRQMVSEGLVDPESWALVDEARDRYVAGQGASLIFNGGGHIARINSDMALAGTGTSVLLPAPDTGTGQRGYTAEPMFWGRTFLGGMSNNNPVAAARVINFLISEEGYRLTAIGIEGIDYEMVDGNIHLLDARHDRGFPTEAGDTGAHPMASTIVSWVPQDWQNFAALYGQDQSFIDAFNTGWANQGMYRVNAYGILKVSPKWVDFQATGNELIARSFLDIVNAGSDQEAGMLFDQFVKAWNDAGGASATEEMSALLTEVYGS